MKKLIVGLVAALSLVTLACDSGDVGETYGSSIGGDSDTNGADLDGGKLALPSSIDLAKRGCTVKCTLIEGGKCTQVQNSCPDGSFQNCSAPAEGETRWSCGEWQKS